MPDGDNIHPRVKPRYYQTYQQLCEGKLDNDEIAHTALKALKGDLKKYGEAPLRLLQEAARRLSMFSEAPLLRMTADWGQLGRDFNRLASEIDGNRRGMGIALNATKAMIVELQRGHAVSDVLGDLSQHYVENIYRANFSESVPLTNNHHEGADPALVQARLDELKPPVRKGMDYLAQQIARTGSTDRLAIGPRRRKETLSLDTDLLTFRKRTGV